jgi:hypothetical protein
LERLADDPNSSVTFNAISKSFALRSRDDRWVVTIQYCFWCGGKAPNGTELLFVASDSVEEQEFLRIAQHCHDTSDVTSLFGPPDRVLTVEELGLVDVRSPKPVVCYYQYLRRWKTIDATILVFSDGTIGSCFSRKFDRASFIERITKEESE